MSRSHARGRSSRPRPTSRSPSRRSSRSSTPPRSTSSNRFEEVQAAASQGTALEEHLVGELIASEVEVRTGRCETFADVPAEMAERRAQLQALVEPMGLLLGATGTHPWADWKEQRIIDTPHYRRNDELLRYVVWRNNTFGLHVHVGITGADRAVAVVNGDAQLPAGAARALGQLAVRRGRRTPGSTRRARRSSRASSRAAASRTRSRAGPSTRATSASSTTRARSPSTRRSGGACARTSPSRPWRSGSATGSPTSPRRSRSPRSRTRSTARVARALDEGEPVRAAAAPADRGELVARDPLRPLGRADRLRPRRADPGAAAARGADRVGRCPSPRRSAPRRTSRFPPQNAAERQIARCRGGATLEEIYAEQVAGDGDDRWLSGRGSRPKRSSLEALDRHRRGGRPRPGALDDRPRSASARLVAGSPRSRPGRLAIDAMRALDPRAPRAASTRHSSATSSRRSRTCSSPTRQGRRADELGTEDSPISALAEARPPACDT